jgi:putative endonuclease
MSIDGRLICKKIMPDKTRSARRRAYRRGVWAERLAAIALLFKGYRILHFRYRTGVGEIDLVARRGKVLAFVEVKSRKGGATAEAVHPAQASRLVRAGNAFLAKNPALYMLDIRFDVMLCGGFGWPKHIKSAWQADNDSKTAVF